MTDERNRWEERYLTKEGAPVAPSSRFLQEHLHILPQGLALDVACGDGRHALLLARNRFVVHAVDIARNGLLRARAIARREALPVRLIQADLERPPFRPHRYDTVINIRYLERSLWPLLKHTLRDGGCILIETFLRDPQAIGHPSNPCFLLERGELARTFSNFELLVYEEGLFETESGPAFLARMIAQRPRGWASD